MTSGAFFWDWFAQNEGRLWQAGAASIDEVLAKLHESHPNVGIEVSDSTDGRRELVLTAHGDASLADSVIRLGEQAPELEHWAVTSLKPPRGFDFVFESGGHRIDPRSLCFEPLARSDAPDSIGIRVLASDAQALPMLDKAIGSIIEMAIGERAVAAIERIEVAQLKGSAADQIPLTDLPAYIQWRWKGSI